MANCAFPDCKMVAVTGTRCCQFHLSMLGVPSSTPSTSDAPPAAAASGLSTPTSTSGSRPTVKLPKTKLLETIQGVKILKVENAKLSTAQRSRAKVILVLGETGSGKTTLINSMVNYLLGIPSIEHKERYKLVVETFGTSQTVSQTSDVTEYRIENTVLGVPVIIVDTPGFADTRSAEQDLKTKNQVASYLLDSCPNLHAICFVAKANVNRLTVQSKYVIDQVLQFFGNDAHRNLIAMATFADHKKPSVQQALEEAKVPIAKLFRFNNSIVFPEEDDEYDIESPIATLYWEMFISGMTRFFDCVKTIHPIALDQTHEVIKLRRNLELTVVGLEKEIQHGLENMKRIDETLAQMKKHKDDIMGNKNFTYTVQETTWVNKDLPAGVHTTWCSTCNRTCHENCIFSNDIDKKRCSAMSLGRCTVCPGRCDWSMHQNRPYVVVSETKTVVKEYAEMKKKLLQANEEVLNFEDVMERLGNEYLVTKKHVHMSVIRMQKVLRELSDIALQQSSTSVIDYMDFMIQNEKEQMAEGWTDRIKQLEAIKNAHSLIIKAKDKDPDALLQDYFGEELAKRFEEMVEIVEEVKRESGKGGKAGKGRKLIEHARHSDDFCKIS